MPNEISGRVFYTIQAEGKQLAAQRIGILRYAYAHYANINIQLAQSALYFYV